jgi:putative flippase GtrA
MSAEMVGPVPMLEVVIPVYNEELALPIAITRVTEALDRLPWSWQLTIADNASTDGTETVARRLVAQHPRVRLVSLPDKGRGRALKQVWLNSIAPVLVYMDVDLSTDLNALMPLVAPLLSGHSDMAIGSRLHRNSRVVRGPRRELVSRSYNVLLRSTLQAGFTDAQCGFKAIRREVAAELLPLVEDDTWFFDTELLVLAERAGLRIHEVPVDWIDDPDSRVDVVRTALDDLRGIRRLGWSLVTGRLRLDEVSARLGVAAAGGRVSTQIALFACVGILSTAAYATMFLVLRQVWPAQVANLSALLLTAVANTALNRRFTFAVHGDGLLRHQLQGLLVFGAGLLMTSGALWILGDEAEHWVEIVVLTAANLVVTVVRFVAMRLWIFRRSPARMSELGAGQVQPADERLTI